MLSKYKLLTLVIIVIGIIILVIVPKNNGTYVVTINKVDDQSPSRILKVFKDDEEIEFKEIRYKDDVFLCNNNNPSVFYGDVIDEKELKVIIADNMSVIAKVLNGGENGKK